MNMEDFNKAKKIISTIDRYKAFVKTAQDIDYSKEFTDLSEAVRKLEISYFEEKIRNLEIELKEI